MEFIVVGTPRSANAPNRSRRRWREGVSRAARERLREEGGAGPTDQDLSVLIIYFYRGETTLDVDNIAKSLLDGLKGVVFRNDQQVSELRVRKSRLSAGLPLAGASLYLLNAIERVADKLRFRVCAHRSRAQPRQDPMNADTDLITSERGAIQQYAEWYTQQGYQVSIEPSPRELPEFLRTLAPDMIARRDGENVVVQIKTSSPASFEAVQRLARALDHRAGWTLQEVYADLPDPEWQPPPGLPERKYLLARLDRIDGASEDEDQRRLDFLLLWSIVEAAARHRLSSLKISPTSRISSSALLKMLVTEGIIEDDDYAVLRRGLAARNAIAHGFLNQSVDTALFEHIRRAANGLLGARNRRRATP